MKMLASAAMVGLVLGAGLAAAGSIPVARNVGVAIPAGWRAPTTVELGTRGSSRAGSGIVVFGDFNCDGREDEAALLVTTDGSRGALFAFISEPSGLRMKLLFERDARGIKGVTISRVSPGRYPTMCSKGYYACAPGEAKNITLRCDAIDENYSERADVYYYWDLKTKSFQAVQMSD